MDSKSKYTFDELIASDSFHNFVFGTSQQDIELWESYLKKSDTDPLPVTEARDFLMEFNFADKSYDHLRAANKSKIDDLISGKDANEKEEVKVKKIRKFPVVKIAATLLLLLSVSFTTYYVLNNDITLPGTQGISNSGYVEKETSKSQRSTVLLSDGTEVKMNAESKLRFKPNFDENKREVFLEGEAWFKVEKDPSRPFIVHVGNLTAEVLGTSFNIRSYDEDNNIKIALVEGSLRVGDKESHSVLMKPTDLVVYDKEKQDVQTTTYNNDEDLSWIDNTLYFNKSDINEIIVKLERWYGVEIDLQTELQDKAFSGKFKHQSLEKVLSGIGFSLHFEYEIKGNTVIIK